MSAGALRILRQCVQHNDKFLQRQDYWRETAPAAIDRTGAIEMLPPSRVLAPSSDARSP